MLGKPGNSAFGRTRHFCYFSVIVIEYLTKMQLRREERLRCSTVPEGLPSTVVWKAWQLEHGSTQQPRSKEIIFHLTQEAERVEEVGPGCKTSKPASGDRLPPARLHFPKAPDL